MLLLCVCCCCSCVCVVVVVVCVLFWGLVAFRGFVWSLKVVDPLFKAVKGLEYQMTETKIS